MKAVKSVVAKKFLFSGYQAIKALVEGVLLQQQNCCLQGAMHRLLKSTGRTRFHLVSQVLQSLFRSLGILAYLG